MTDKFGFFKDMVCASCGKELTPDTAKRGDIGWFCHECWNGGGTDRQQRALDDEMIAALKREQSRKYWDRQRMEFVRVAGMKSTSEKGVNNES